MAAALDDGDGHPRIEQRGPVGWLFVDDGRGARRGLADAWRALDADPDVRVIVCTGAGRAFDGGAEPGPRPDPAATAWVPGPSKPLIVAVNGLCAGGGFRWVARADIVLAAADAEFCDPHVSVGQPVDVAAVALLRRVPAEAVLRMALLGRHERMSAERAYELGMVSEVVDPPSRLRARAQELGETVARNSPAAMAATKRALWGALEHGLSEACRLGARHLVSLWGHPDQDEGPRAFAERRDPVWAPPTASEEP